MQAALTLPSFPVHSFFSSFRSTLLHLLFFPALAPLSKALSKTETAKRKCTALNWHLESTRLFTLLLCSVLLFRLGLGYLPLLWL